MADQLGLGIGHSIRHSHLQFHPALGKSDIPYPLLIWCQPWESCPLYGQYWGWKTRVRELMQKWVGYRLRKGLYKGGEACRENPEEVVSVKMSSDVGSGSAYLAPPHLKHFSELESDSRISLPCRILASKYDPSTLGWDRHQCTSDVKDPQKWVALNCEIKTNHLRFFSLKQKPSSNVIFWVCTSEILFFFK